MSEGFIYEELTDAQKAAIQDRIRVAVERCYCDLCGVTPGERCLQANGRRYSRTYAHAIRESAALLLIVFGKDYL